MSTVKITGATIGHSDDTDILTFADGSLAIANDVDVNIAKAGGLQIAGTAVNATAAELNIMDGGTSSSTVTVADADRLVLNDAGTMKQVSMDQFETYFESALDTLSNVTTVGTIGSGVWEGTVVASAYLDSDTAHLSTAQTFSGAKTFSADASFTGDTNTFSSANSTDPLVIIKNTTNDANGARLRFVKDKGAAGADNDVAGIIEFYADDDNQDQVLFAQIKATVADASNSAEGGKLELGVASHDGEMNAGITITDGSVEDEIDVTIGKGTSSVTTIAGDLTVTGTTTTVNQTIIESTVSVLVFEGATADAHETTLKVVEPTADCTFSLPTLSADDYFIPAIADTATDASAAVTAAEFALLDGGSTVGTTAVASGDGIFTNNGGLMMHTNVDTFDTYLSATTKTLSNKTLTSPVLTTPTVTTSLLPTNANAATLGSAAKEFGDLFLGDGGTIQFGNDQEIVLTHVADVGLTLSATTTTDPVLTIENTNADATGGKLKFNKNGTSPATGDVIGNIDFASEDGDNNATTYARITSTVVDVTADGEQGGLSFLVAENDGALTEGLAIDGLSSDGNITVDVTTHDGAAGGLMLGGTLVTSTAAELNLVDGTAAGTVLASKAVIYDSGGGIKIGDASTNDRGILFDGNAVDFSINIDDSADSLTFAVGSTSGGAGDAFLITDAGSGVGMTTFTSYTKFNTDKPMYLGTSSDYILVHGDSIPTNSGAGSAVGLMNSGGGAFQFAWSSDGNTAGSVADAGDTWIWGITEGSSNAGQLTLGNDIAAKNTTVTHLTITPHATTTSATMVFTGEMTAKAYNTSSDRSLKSNIRQLDSSLDKIMMMRGVEFDWKASGNHDVGFIAQEVQEIVPELVGLNDTTGTLTVGYSRVTALLVEAVKEQQEEIKGLRAQVGQVNELKQMVLALMNK